VVRDAARLFGIALAAGGVGAWAAGRLLEHHLVGVSATDPLSLAVAAGLLLLSATAAAGLPARQAATVDPAELLRHG
jgi:ABC-type antimicrobial peptide transport system permease subunit